MYQEILQKAGLSLNEARVYEALLNLGEVNVNKISIKSKVHRRNVYDSLNKLIEKGLASETFIKGEKSFKAINPERLKEIIKEKDNTYSLNCAVVGRTWPFNPGTQRVVLI
ncbi:MAG: helix-turn-helix domain-containing protein, partial [Nanoarchaeota archaeon]|nr:helix-turn-helix domain-containing protein [Nanoarchaeota archaeon]